MGGELGYYFAVMCPPWQKGLLRAPLAMLVHRLCVEHCMCGTTIKIVRLFSGAATAETSLMLEKFLAYEGLLQNILPPPKMDSLIAS